MRMRRSRLMLILLYTCMLGGCVEGCPDLDYNYRIVKIIITNKCDSGIYVKPSSDFLDGSWTPASAILGHDQSQEFTTSIPIKGDDNNFCTVDVYYFKNSKKDSFEMSYDPNITRRANVGCFVN